MADVEAASAVVDEDYESLAHTKPPEPEPARVMEMDEVKARRRAMKAREFRQYLVDAGLVEAIVKMFVGLLEADQLPHLDDSRPETHLTMGNKILTDFFGEYRDPAWDEVGALEAENVKLRQSIEQLKEKIPELEESIVKARTDKAGRQWWAAVAGKAGNPTAESLNAKELIAALQPTGGVLDSIKKSGGLTQDDVLHFLHASGDDCMVRLTQSWADAISDEQPFMYARYPLNPQLGQLKDRNPIAVSRFSQEQVAQTLAHVAPAVVGLTHMARVLKAGHALEYYAKSGGRRRF
ncbi:hypothetical protein FOZ63_025001, partial [Perkinsus olseni]